MRLTVRASFLASSPRRGPEGAVLATATGEAWIDSATRLATSLLKGRRGRADRPPLGAALGCRRVLLSSWVAIVVAGLRGRVSAIDAIPCDTRGFGLAASARAFAHRVSGCRFFRPHTKYGAFMARPGAWVKLTWCAALTLLAIRCTLRWTHMGHVARHSSCTAKRCNRGAFALSENGCRCARAAHGGQACTHDLRCSGVRVFILRSDVLAENKCSTRDTENEAILTDDHQ